MEAKSKQRNVRVPKAPRHYVTEDGERLQYPVLPGNVPRFSGIRTGADETFLSVNKGKLSKLQQKMA